MARAQTDKDKQANLQVRVLEAVKASSSNVAPADARVILAGVWSDSLRCSMPLSMSPQQPAAMPATRA